MRLIMLMCCLLWYATISGQGRRIYKLSATIQRALAADTTPWKNTMASYDYSYAGNYAQALSYGDSALGIRKNAPLSASDSAYLAEFTPVPARQYILEKSAAAQIMIINEAHHQPRHRTFVTGLLKDLYQQGYRYLGIETLGYTDTMLQQRKYALDTTGYYSFEPQFGNMIRQALQLGFILFPYETEVHDHNGKEREIDHANNIVRFMKQHTGGKYLIYCGYGHVTEDPVRGWEKAMAGRLKEYTGINPFTINQEILTEHSSPVYEHPDFTAVHASFPAVLINAKQQVYNGLARDSSVDVLVYHPRTLYLHGRPDWLWQNLPRKTVFVSPKQISIGYPLLIQAYRKDEDTVVAVPYDVVELKDAREKKALALENGQYRLVLKNEQDLQTIDIQVRQDR